MQHTNTNTTMQCTEAKRLIEIVNEFCDW